LRFLVALAMTTRDLDAPLNTAEQRRLISYIIVLNKEALASIFCFFLGTYKMGKGSKMTGWSGYGDKVVGMGCPWG